MLRPSPLATYKSWVRRHPGIVNNLDWLLYLGTWSPSRLSGSDTGPSSELLYKPYHALVGEGEVSGSGRRDGEQKCLMGREGTWSPPDCKGQTQSPRLSCTTRHPCTGERDGKGGACNGSSCWLPGSYAGPWLSSLLRYKPYHVHPPSAGRPPCTPPSCCSMAQTRLAPLVLTCLAGGPAPESLAVLFYPALPFAAAALHKHALLPLS